MADLARFRMYVDGDWVDAHDGAVFQSLNPHTAQPWAIVPAAGEVDVHRAVSAAQRAFEDGPWSRMSASDRGRALRRLADLLPDHAERLARAETLDTGKLLSETRFQVGFIAQVYEFHAGLADKIHGETLALAKPDLWGMTVREPIGVMAAVVPWNSQLFLTANKIAPALAAGNTIVIKASELAPVALLEFMRVVEEADFPPGVINLVTGHGEPCGRALTTHPDVARISFTGGVDTARIMVRNSAENLAELSLELGGKSPVLLFDDADRDSAVNGVLAGIFGASGQSCVAGSRLLVHESLRESIVEELAGRAAAIRIGDPLDAATQMGPLATERQLLGIEEAVARSVKQGARLVCGGERPDGLGSGWYYAPTIVDCPDPGVEVVERELFGPVLSVIGFRDEDDAVRIANDTRYGLACGIFTRDGARALRVARRIRAGVVWINTYRVVSPHMPYGGFKDSGYGREGGLHAVLECTREKSVLVNLSPQPIANPFVMR